MQYKQLRAFVSPTPIQLTSIPKSADAEEKVLEKLHSFFANENKTQLQPDTLALTTEEINHLIRTSESLSALKLDYHLELEETTLVARNSLPSSHLIGVLSLLSKVLRVEGYLNSEMEANLTFEKDEIKLMPLAAKMNGLDAPVSVLNRKGGVDLSEWIADQGFYHLVLSRLQAVQIRHAQVLLIKKP